MGPCHRGPCDLLHSLAITAPAVLSSSQDHRVKQVTLARRILWVLLMLVAPLLIWRVAVEAQLIVVEQQTAEIPNLAADWEGECTAVIADFQVGVWLDITRALYAVS